MRSHHSRKLRHAAATIFALTAILPLLLFLSYLWRFDLLVKTEVQIGLLLALVIALLGYAIFRRMVDRISDLVLTLKAAAPADPAPPERDTAGTLPGLGAVNEIGEMALAFNRMLEELRASTERLEDLVFKLGSLNEMVEIAAKIPKIQDLLAHVLDRTMRTVRAGIGSIMLLDPERRTLRVVAARGLAEDTRIGVEIKVGEGIAGKVVELGEPVLVEDIERDTRFAKASDPKYDGGSFISMPLRVADRIVGVVNLAKKYAPGSASSPRSFSGTDLQFLNTLLTYTAYAVDNARLLEEAQKAAQRLNEVVEDQQLRLTLAQQQMVQAAKLSALGELVAGVAHELNNPLCVLLGAVELLIKDAPASFRSRLDLMLDAVERARRIVGGLATFARQMPLERRGTNLGELLEKVLSITAADLRLAQVEVETDVEPELPPVWADGNQLYQVLLNLITNAKQAMAEAEGERRLSITIQRAGQDRIRICVSDTGPGIPADLLSRVFDPFVTTKGVHGTGLGLSISYGIIREHSGQISVESKPGHGACFTIDLPIGAAAAAAAPAETPRPAGSLAGQRILVVEDDESVKGTWRHCLEQAGGETVAVSSAEEALEALGESVQVVVCDLHLPGMNGVAFYEQAIARYPRLSRRFVFVTGGIVPETAHRIVNGPDTRLLRKPFAGQQLLEAVSGALG
jgi:signal transduction histidine kinase/CheY-like chemotaxis protein/HAMP domain-containing protein